MSGREVHGDLSTEIVLIDVLNAVIKQAGQMSELTFAVTRFLESLFDSDIAHRDYHRVHRNPVLTIASKPELSIVWTDPFSAEALKRPD